MNFEFREAKFPELTRFHGQLRAFDCRQWSARVDKQQVFLVILVVVYASRLAYNISFTTIDSRGKEPLFADKEGQQNSNAN